MKRIAFFASHNGSAARAITMACRDGRLTNASPLLLVSNNANAMALNWARELALQAAVVNSANTQDPDQKIADLLLDNAIDLVICSGYMRLIGPKTIQSVPHILNVHPALLPRYGGKGMYGAHVHRAVFENKDGHTGITIHLVDGEYDHGKILAQKILPLESGDTAEDIERKTKAAEPAFYIEVLQRLLSGDIRL